MEQSIEQKLQTATEQVLPVNFKAIPQEITQEPYRWVVWRYEAGARGELKKPPLNARTGRPASHSDPTSWSSFAEARRAYEQGGYAGVGLVLTGGLVGIDIDACIHAGVIHPSAQAIIAQMGTYFERSPSGTGIRGLIYGALPGPFKRRGKIEMYERQRYVTLTGQHLPETPLAIARRDRALQALYQRIFTPSAPVRSPLPRMSVEPGDAPAIIHKALGARNGATFRRYLEADQSLWNGPGARHPSKSEADFTFCLMLAYWTRGNAALVDDIFRTSALFDEKWDRPTAGSLTYGQVTIEKALRVGRTA